jgi:hypothetical protein
VQRVLGDDLQPSAVFSLAGSGVQSFQGGFADVLPRARTSAASNCGRTRIRVLIFSEKILPLGMPYAARASSCDSNTCTADTAVSLVADAYRR